MTGPYSDPEDTAGFQDWLLRQREDRRAVLRLGRAKRRLARDRHLRATLAAGADVSTVMELEQGYSRARTMREELDQMDRDTQAERPGWVPPWKRARA